MVSNADQAGQAGNLPMRERRPGLLLKTLAELADVRNLGLVYAFILLFIALSIASPAFSSTRNLLNVADGWAPVAIMALGGTVVLLTGGFDLSIGGIFVVSSVVSTTVANDHTAYVGLASGVLAGALLGFVNGILITVGRMNPFVATIGSTIVYTGLATVISDGFVISVADLDYHVLGQKRAGVYVSIYILILIVALTYILINRTTYGRYVRATGGNHEAARLAGIRVNVVTIAAYAASGLCCGLAAVIVASGSLSSTNFTSINFSVWAALLLGGNSINGGIGSVWRTMIGVGVLALVQNGSTLLGVEAVYQQLATGVIFLGAVLIDSRMRRAVS
jgi:ribose transport system permease protein